MIKLNNDTTLLPMSTDGYPSGRMFRADIYMIISHQNM